MNSTNDLARKGQENSTSPQLEAAFEALKTYDLGSSRGALVPIDEAVIAALKDAKSRLDIERRIIAALETPRSSAAKEYLCSKLTLIGSKASVPSLARLLEADQIATAARNPLQTMPCPEAGKALLACLADLRGSARIGVINSLRARRAPESLRALTALLKSPDPTVVGAALAAVGEIGSARAGKVLRSYKAKATDAFRSQWADAVLVCAGRLETTGRSADAELLYLTLNDSAQPAHVKLAAERGLDRVRS